MADFSVSDLRKSLCSLWASCLDGVNIVRLGNLGLRSTVLRMSRHAAAWQVGLASDVLTIRTAHLQLDRIKG